MAGKGEPEIETREPWLRERRETSRAYELFCAYRDLGPGRSLSKARASAKGMPSLIRLKQLSKRWDWVERARCYDDHIEEERRIQQEKERRSMHDRHAKIAMLGQSIVVNALEKLLAKVQTGDGELIPGDMTRLFDISVKVERLARGESTDIRESIGPGGGPLRLSVAKPDEQEPDLSRLSDEQLEQLKALMEIANGEGEAKPLTSCEPEATETSQGTSAQAHDTNRE